MMSAAFTTGGDLVMGLLGKLKRLSGAVLLLLFLLTAPVAHAQEDQGEEVYGDTCSACHGSTGAGLSGTFPPLAGNSSVQDAAYVDGVIRNGIKGELVVQGVTYNGQMPSFGDQLSDEEIAAVVDFVQNRLGVSAGGETAEPVDESEPFPWNLVMLGSAQTVLVVGLVFLLTSPRRKKELTWWNAYGRAILIFLFFVLATTWLPSWALTQEAVAGAPRLVGDLLGSGLWMVMLAAGIGALIWLQRTERI
jgi:mono/diheme cytochrome c family protein